MAVGGDVEDVGCGFRQSMEMVEMSWYLCVVEYVGVGGVFSRIVGVVEVELRSATRIAIFPDSLLFECDFQNRVAESQ